VSGQLAQLVIHERQKLLCGGGIALLDGGQDAGDVTHRGTGRTEQQCQKFLARSALRR
jgi:hypothetical protein